MEVTVQIAEYVTSEWHAMLAGGGIYAVLREVVGFALRLYAARLRSDDDPKNDAFADVVDDAARRLGERK
jgi:hypothetical protein